MMNQSQKPLVLALLLCRCLGAAAAGDAPSHPRPFFMPEGERQRIRRMVREEPWASREYEKIKKAARRSAYWAAFLHAVEGGEQHLPVVREYLLKYAAKGGDVHKAREHLNDPNYFKAGQPWLAPVYYSLDISHLVVYDWVYNALSPEERRTVEDGILTSARYRMRCMDRWSQTANLVFKPTFMVAMAGLATGDEQCLRWGFHRKPGSSRGGYFEAMDVMLRDGGPWHEAPIYPIHHTGLWCMAVMSRYRRLYDGGDWFRRASPGGGSPKGLMDYYIDTAYPIERATDGGRRIRVATYGDGATNAGGDLFLVDSTNRRNVFHKALTACYNASGDGRYAPFVALVPGYAPDLWNNRPVPARTEFPAAPSNVWPSYGLAMLRSDESPGYWTNGQAIAVFQVMSQGYGHDHRDKFAIMLHAAGRLLYPDYNAIQYENPAVGWTRNSVAHNTVLVDEQDTRNAEPTDIRHDFAPEAKFLATSASGVFEGVDQTRALLLTGEYLLDLFHLHSVLPHTYDYLLHSLGSPRAAEPGRFKPSKALEQRYWLVEDQRAMATEEPWSIDLATDETATRGAVRLSVAAEPDTLVVHGRWGKDLARLVAQRARGDATMDLLTLVAARRARRRSTLFVATHEPYAGGDRPEIKAVDKLAQTPEAVVVRIQSARYTDYAAVAFGPQKGNRVHLLAAGGLRFAFRSYGYLRVGRDGGVAARGGWQGFRIPRARGALTVNGRPARSRVEGNLLVFGNVSGTPQRPPAAAPECPLPIEMSPAVVRAFARDAPKATFAVTNALEKPVRGWLEFDLPKGLSVEPARPAFGPIQPGASARLEVTVRVNRAGAGRHTVPYRVLYRPEGATEDIRTAALPMAVAVGPTLEFVYQHPKPAVYRIHAPRYTAKFDMFHGLCRHLADPDDVVRLDGSPLFTFSDGKTPMLFEGTKKAFTWVREAPADLLAHANDRCRWRALLMGNQIVVRMDRGWTRFERTHFTVPGRWLSPGGPPRWKRVVGVDGAGKEVDARPGANVRVSAAELEFPGGAWNMAFRFRPPTEVTFEGTRMTFAIGSLTGDGWSVGFCRPGTLDAWRGKQ